MSLTQLPLLNKEILQHDELGAQSARSAKSELRPEGLMGRMHLQRTKIGRIAP